jgi:hypothetical protein
MPVEETEILLSIQLSQIKPLVPGRHLGIPVMTFPQKKRESSNFTRLKIMQNKK